MQKRIWPGTLLLIVLLVLAACGTGNGEEDGGESSGNQATGEMKSMIEQLDDDTYRYTVANKTEEAITFHFTSGQRFDFSLTDDAGEQVFLFSSVSSFIQAMGEETVEPGEELKYELDIPQLDLEAGSYKLEAWLTPEEGPAYPAETEYTAE